MENVDGLFVLPSVLLDTLTHVKQENKHELKDYLDMRTEEAMAGGGGGERGRSRSASHSFRRKRY